VHSETGRPERTTMSITDDTSVPTVLPSKLTGSRFCQLGVGLSIVSKLTPFSLFEKSVKNYFEINKASALEGPLIMSALPQLRLDLERLAMAGNDSFDVYAEITRNTIQPLDVSPTMAASEFHTLFTGKNLRWETLGLILIIAGSNAQFTSPDDPIFTVDNGRTIDKDAFIEEMMHASNDCITLCQVHGAVNDVMVWLIYHSKLHAKKQQWKFILTANSAFRHARYQQLLRGQLSCCLATDGRLHLRPLRRGHTLRRGV
jgi:hypothetical protein